MSSRTIELHEWREHRFPEAALSRQLGAELWSQFGKRLEVGFPSPLTNDHWVLRSKGWVGVLRPTTDLTVVIRPKTPIGNLFGMLEYAYQLRSFHFLDGLFDGDSLDDLYDTLASLLASQVLLKLKKGLYRDYEQHRERLAFVRGRIDLPQAVQNPHRLALPCAYDEHGADVPDNRILLWTLLQVLRTGICRTETREQVARAVRGLRGRVGLEEYRAAECVGRDYHRLNADYESLHALCRFFLDNQGPKLDSGQHRSIPFVVSMHRLFEAFVAGWLREHLPAELRLSVQERRVLEPINDLHFDIDLVLRDAASGKPVVVVDTKYKQHAVPSASDVAQVVAYCTDLGCKTAVLLYPEVSAFERVQVGPITVLRMGWPLDGDLNVPGWAVVRGIGRLQEPKRMVRSA